MFKIWKRFDFSAAHHLNLLHADHPCSRPHGHNYSVEVEISASDHDAIGFVLDYRTMDEFKHYIDNVFDHRNLNDFITQPTAEILASYLHQQAAAMFDSTRVQVTAVRVRETDKTCAEYSVPLRPIVEIV